MTDKWAEHKQKFCGCKDASRLNRCQGRNNCELPEGHPERVSATPQPSAVPDGWRLIPTKPTIEMVEAGYEESLGQPDRSGHARIIEVFDAMLAAAPSAPATVQGDALTGEYHADVNRLLGVNQQLLEALEGLLVIAPDATPEEYNAVSTARAAIAAARKEGGKV